MINELYIEIITKVLEKGKENLTSEEFEILVITVHKVINDLIKKSKIIDIKSKK